MTIQIAVRLPDEVVAFVDSVVAQGGATSRADLVTRALAREQRRLAAENDALILERLAAAGERDDLDDLVTWSSTNPVDIDAD